METSMPIWVLLRFRLGAMKGRRKLIANSSNVTMPQLSPRIPTAVISYRTDRDCMRICRSLRARHGIDLRQLIGSQHPVCCCRVLLYLLYGRGARNDARYGLLRQQPRDRQLDQRMPALFRKGFQLLGQEPSLRRQKMRELGT